MLARFYWDKCVPAAARRWGTTKLAVGDESPADSDLLYKPVCQHGQQRIAKAMHWALVQSDHWGKDGKGALDGVEGFLRALKTILVQMDKFEQTRKGE